jgi:glucans biosynthesis protein C
MQQAVQRRYYIDWIRVLAFFLLIFFHCAMPFVIFGWEVKNEDTSMGLSRLIWWMHQWRIPLLYLRRWYSLFIAKTFCAQICR